MLWDAAISSVMRTGTISTYCDERGPKLNCRGGQKVIVEPDHSHSSL